MGVRRQIYLAEADDRLLEERSRASGVSVSALIRRAVNECYGLSPRLTWDEVFANPKPPGGAGQSPCGRDALFDDFDLIDDPR